MANYVVTIARQFGSLGRQVGKALAKELNFNYYDRYILEQSAQILDISLQSLTALDERGIRGYHKMIYPLGIGNGVTQDKLFNAQSSLIKECAQQENCVIIGRCSDYILRDHDRVLSCYIYAPYLKRLENCIDELKINVSEAKAILDNVDKARAEYYMHYTGCEFNTTYFRDLLIDSSLLGVDGTADLISTIVKKAMPG